MPSRIVLTGGPCAGKSSVLRQLQAWLKDEAVFVPEAATQLFESGMPLPQPDWSERDWLHLQRAITARQLANELAAEAQAWLAGRPLIICDRAPFDNVAYPMGEVAIAELMTLEASFGYHRYDMVLHLESLATARPGEYGRIGNTARYESLAEAQALEQRARAAWQGHPRWVFLPGTLTVSELAATALEHIQRLLPSHNMTGAVT